MRHAEIDLETLGTLPGSIILSLGVVLFDPTKPPEECLGETLYCVIGQPTCEAVGLTCSQSTLDWWKGQSAEARTVLTQAQDPTQSIGLKKALESLTAFLPPDVRVWSNGANFDQPLLDVAYSKFGMQVPWKYYNSRCHRTVIALYPNEKASRPPTVLAHNALEDAKWQAKHLVNVAQKLGLVL